MKDRSVFKQQARVLKALANESRLIIIDRLNRGESSVGELTELIGSDVSTVSKHLALLRANGIVDDRRQGTTVFYRLLTPCVCNFFACATAITKENQVDIEIKVLGPGCGNCKRLYAEAQKAVDHVCPATITKVEDIKDIMAYKILATPALVINGEIKSAGRIPSAAEITTWLATAAMSQEAGSAR